VEGDGHSLNVGKVKTIGVSTFTVIYLKDLIAATGIKPSVNQVELHPYLHQDDLPEYARMEGIHLTDHFTPKQGYPTLLQDKIVNELARNYSATPAQVVLAWGLSRGYSVIPKSVTAERIKSNQDQIMLSNEDL